MAVFTPNFTSSSADLDEDIYFGVGEPHSDFVTPVMKFTFKQSDGATDSSIGNVILRMTSSFETVLANPFQETEGIFGQPGNIDGIASALQTVGGSALESLKKQFIGGAGNLVGFVASAGSSGKTQVEFLTRHMFNNFQQLIYKGPNFRRFSPSFTMRPTSLNEAKNMKKIISRFKIASSPKSGLGITAFSFDENKFTTQEDESTGGAVGAGASSENKLVESETIENLLGVASGASFTFGYPDTCAFEIMLYNGKDDDIATVFSSKLCVIENVSVTYGAQNKLTFFDNGYFPSEVVLNLALREAVLQTENDAINEYNSTYTIL